MKRARMVIYDCADMRKVIELPDKEIKSIEVLILSGDEIAIVNFDDGTSLEFDASDSRLESFFDGYYEVEGDRLARWLDFDATGKQYLSYTRKEEMQGKEDANV